MKPTAQEASSFTGSGVHTENSKSSLLSGGWGKTEGVAPQKVRGLERRAKVLEAVLTLHEADKAITRQRIKDITGFSASACDDHVNRLVDEGFLTRLAAGVFEVVPQYPKSRLISHTLLPDGMSNTEIGDTVLILTPKERRSLAKLLFADAIEHSHLQGSQDFNVLVSEMTTSMLLLRRGQLLQEHIATQLGIPLDPATKGLSDRLAALAERFLQGQRLGC